MAYRNGGRRYSNTYREDSMSWNQKPLRHAQTGATIEQVLKFNAVALPNGEAAAVYVNVRSGNQLEAIYIRADGTFVPLGQPFPNGGKEDSGAIWLTDFGARAIGASQIGSRGIDNQLQMAEMSFGWASDAIKIWQSQIKPPITIPDPSPSTDSAELKALRDRIARLEQEHERMKSELRQAAADLMEASN